MISDALERLYDELPSGVKLVAVSKFHPLSAILEAYAAGQRFFGENRPQEFAAKAVQLPQDIEWHFLGHLQTNKLKLVLPYASLVESVDSTRLLDAIDSWAVQAGKKVRVLLEVHIGAEETKQGFAPDEIQGILANALKWPGIVFCGLMGMASHTDDEERIRADFACIRQLFSSCRDSFPGLGDFRELSIGMSDDWRIAIEYGATIVRIGTAIFGRREY